MEGQDKEDKEEREGKKSIKSPSVQIEIVWWAVSKKEEWDSIYVCASGLK